jgi:eukaryotic-like serine/threonine-protein kinase
MTRPGPAASSPAPPARPYTPGVDATLQDPLVGRELDGRYLVRSRIARGGMATVYLAVDRRLDREVALKVMHAHLADDEQFTDRFIREARSAARLSHPNVVQVFDQASDGDLLYLAMEYLRGRTLREVLAERRVLTPREALTVIEPVLDGLSAAHRIGIVHRDIKPENVILTDEGRVKVADFGLARASTANTSTTGALMGTVAYLAPELVLRGVADTRSDVYAAGIMLFEMLTGCQPFTGDVPVQVAYQHVNDPMPVPSSVAPGVPAALDGVVAAATARESDDRPADADELLRAVRTAHAGLSADELDTRPAPPRPGASAVPMSTTRAVGSVTEIFDSPRAAPQLTRALPDLGAMPQLGARPELGAMPVPGLPAPGRVNGAPSPALREDAALAALLQRRRKIGLIGLVAVLGLALVLATSAWYFAAGPGAYTPTPKVTGLTVAKARDVLTRDGLRSREQPAFDATVPSGHVVGTVPAAGQDVRKDGVVVLEVSQGPEQVTVPSLAGMQESAARSALSAAHLVEGAITQVYDDTAPRGQVLQSDPASGQQVHNGSAVAVTVSKGPQPVQVPDVTGQSQQDAESALRNARLGILLDPQVNSDTVPAGSVISQDPAAGAMLLPGQKVTLVLSKGPVLVPVPNVVGQKWADAKTQLEQAGFKVRKLSLFGGLFGTVRFQSPSGGTAPKGSTVTVTLI